MAGMVKNKYQDLAQDIMREDNDERQRMSKTPANSEDFTEEQLREMETGPRPEDGQRGQGDPNGEFVEGSMVDTSPESLNKRLMEMAGERWNESELVEMEKMTPEQIEQVFQNVIEFDFMQHPFVGVIDGEETDPEGTVDENLMQQQMTP